jgi:ADP-ribosylglycohydrolase
MTTQNDNIPDVKVSEYEPSSTPTVEQYKGCIIGCALGDAVGAPIEAKKASQAMEYLQHKVRPMKFEGVRHKRGNYLFGQYTDDTQLTRELMIVLNKDKGKLVPENLAQRISALFKQKKIVGYGRATKNAADRLASGVKWYEAGEPPPAAGNGGAMRASPIGLAYWDNPEDLIKNAATQARITHQSMEAQAGSIAIAGATALALTGEIPDDDWTNTLAEWVSTADEKTGKLILELGNRLTEPPREIVSWLRTFQDPKEKWEGISPYVTSSVLWSLYCFLRTPDEFWRTICCAIYPGGDIDTTAAMAGAISGAYNGLSALPEQIAKMITDKRDWGFVELCTLAEELYKTIHNQEPNLEITTEMLQEELDRAQGKREL